MWAIWFTAALATDLTFSLQTSEGISETWTKDHKEAFTKGYGPVLGKGKRRAQYNVTVMPSVYDPVDDAFQTQVSVCRSWTKKGERGRDCVEDLLMIPSSASGVVRLGGKVKGSDKFEVLLQAAYLGAPPTRAGLPGEAPEPEPEPEPEVVAEEAPPEPGVPVEPEKDAMTSALEEIAAEIVSDLPPEGSEEEEADEDDEDDE